MAILIIERTHDGAAAKCTVWISTGRAKHAEGVNVSHTPTGTLLKQLGFSHMSARPRHPRQDAQAWQAASTMSS
jgi:hypothetical protein